MKTKSFFFWIFLATLFFNFDVSQAQTRSELEAKRKKIKLEIAKVNRLLFSEQKKEKNALEALEDLNKKIVVRTEYLNAINKEAAVLSSEIKQNEKKIASLTKQLNALKKDYAEMIFKSYKSKSKQSQLLFFMSSESFRQAYKRLQYMKQYASFRKKQGDKIVVQTNIVKKLNDTLILKKRVKDTLIKVETAEKEKIEIDKRVHSMIYKKLSQHGTNLSEINPKLIIELCYNNLTLNNEKQGFKKLINDSHIEDFSNF